MSNRPKPTAQKLAEGNRGHRKIEGDDFVPDQVMPETPRGMSRGALREWRLMGKILFGKGVLTQVDKMAFKAYCEHAAQSEIAFIKFNKHGAVIDTFAMDKNENRVFLRSDINPWYKVWLEEQKAMKAFLIEFGLTPASRSRLKLPEKPKEDEFDKLMNKNKPVGFQAPSFTPRPGTDIANSITTPEVK